VTFGRIGAIAIAEDSAGDVTVGPAAVFVDGMDIDGWVGTSTGVEAHAVMISTINMQWIIKEDIFTMR
jgi:hypothetical protein